MNRIAISLAAIVAWTAAPALAGDLVKVASETGKPAASSKRQLYVPPTQLTRLRENTRVQSGATRNGRAPTELRALAPEHTGFTINAQPTIYWYTSRRVDVAVEVIVEAADGPLAPPIVDRRIAPPFEPGLHAVSLADLGVSLEIGREYAWRIIVVVDENKRSNDVYAGANIARVEEPESVKTALGSASPSDRPRIFASAGLWYDALASIERLRSEAGGSKQALNDCRTLLDDQSLQDVSCR